MPHTRKAWVIGILVLTTFSLSHARQNPLNAAKTPYSSPYFPDGVFAENRAKSDAIAYIFSTLLNGMREPSLTRAANERVTSVYRFVWYHPSFNPISLRLEIYPHGGGTLTTKVFTGVRLVRDKTSQVSPSEVSEFLRKIEAAEFWSLSNSQLPEDLDGPSWLLEGKDNDKYQVVYRYYPCESAFTEIGKYLRSLARFIDPSRIVPAAKCK